MICTYIFKDVKNSGLLEALSGKTERNTYLRLTPNNTGNSLWDVEEMKAQKNTYISRGFPGVVELEGVVVSTHSESLAYGVSDWVRQRYGGLASYTPVHGSVFIDGKVIADRNEASGSTPNTIEIKPSHLKRILVTDDKYSTSRGEETGRYMASIVHVASMPDNMCDTELVEQILNENNVAHKSNKPFRWYGQAPIYYNPNYPYTSTSAGINYADQGFEVVCDGGVWEGEETGFTESVHLPIPDLYMPIVYVMPEGTVGKMEVRAHHRLGGHDLFTASTFSVYTDHTLARRVFGIIEKDFGLHYRKQPRKPVVNL